VSSAPNSIKVRPVFAPKILGIFSGGYSRSDLGSDLMAGATVGLIALPLALARLPGLRRM
jgi:hypothetical protein